MPMREEEVICQAAWACKDSDNCVLHGHEHVLGNECGLGLCLNQPELYRTTGGRRRRIRCVSLAKAEELAEKRRQASVAFGA